MSKKETDGRDFDASRCSSSATLVSAMRILANDIQSDDGVANAAIREAADRIEQLETNIKQIHKDYGCEIRDPCGTIWEYASRLQKENSELKSRVDFLSGAIRSAF